MTLIESILNAANNGCTVIITKDKNDKVKISVKKSDIKITECLVSESQCINFINSSIDKLK